MEYNQDELSAPAWLNDEFFVHVIREFAHDQAITLAAKCQIRPGTKAGDHFASVMYRTTVRYRTAGGEQSLDLIMKLKPATEGFKKDLLDGEDFFDREMRIYKEVLPEVDRMLRSIGEEYNYPRLVYTSTTPHTIIILEDISSQGWRMKGLIESFEEMQPTINNIAKFHAASVLLAHNDPLFAAQYRCTIANTFRSMQSMSDTCFASFVKFLRDTLKLPELVESVEKFHQQLDGRLQAAYSTSTTCANVLIHGDFHFKNLLHLQRADQIVDTMFVDYQMSSWSSQVVDLYYLTYMIPEQSVKDGHRDEIIYSYYRVFREILERLNFEGRIPTLIDLQTELLRQGSLEFFHYVVFSAFRYIDLSTVDLEAFFLGRLENPALEKKEFIQAMKKELKRFLHQGIIN
uniref:CHK kinase-like domain-containing protein n=1 Tax=Anopheles atroparvus TaxID=41427 RepID=A0AAG5CV22_ANOAO